MYLYVARLRVLLISLLWLSSGTALAQTPAEPAAPEYEVVLGQALDAHAKGNYEAARLFMERAHALEPSARTLRGLGIVAFSQGQHLAAIRYLDAALASDVKPLTPDLRAAAEELLGHAWAQVARYEVQVDPDSGDYLVDGQAPDFYAPSTLVLSPGKHRLTVRAPARESYELDLDAKAGRRETLRVVLAVTPAPKIVEKIVYAEPQAKAGHPDSNPAWWTPAARYATYGAGAGLALAGGAAWLAGYVKLHHIAQACRETVDGACSSGEAKQRYDHQHIRVFSILGIAGLAAGGSLLVSAATLDFWRYRSRKADRRVGASLAPTGLLLHGTF